MKCPYCNEELDKDMCGEIGCPNEHCKESMFLIGTEELWKRFIQTKQALDKAIWWLNEIVENHRFTPISTAEKALAEIKQITETKENKDEKI